MDVGQRHAARNLAESFGLATTVALSEATTEQTVEITQIMMMLTRTSETLGAAQGAFFRHVQNQAFHVEDSVTIELVALHLGETVMHALATIEALGIDSSDHMAIVVR